MLILIYAGLVAYILLSIEPKHWLHKPKYNRLCRPCLAFWLSIPSAAFGLIDPQLWGSPFACGALGIVFYYFLRGTAE